MNSSDAEDVLCAGRVSVLHAAVATMNTDFRSSTHASFGMMTQPAATNTMTHINNSDLGK